MSATPFRYIVLPTMCSHVDYIEQTTVLGTSLNFTHNTYGNLNGPNSVKMCFALCISAAPDSHPLGLEKCMVAGLR